MESLVNPRMSKKSPLCFSAQILIRIYQGTVSHYWRARGITCLHYPTCSHYGLIAFEKYRFRTALKLTHQRVRNCHPFSGRPYLDYP